MKNVFTILFLLFSFASFAQNTDSAFEAGTKKETLEMVRLKEEGLKQIQKSKWRFPQHYFKAQIAEFKLAPLVEKKDILIYAMQFISGCADGANQAIVYHHAGAGTHFWDYNTSWKNKYRNYDAGDTRSAFFGSKSFFVGITDGNHLTRMVNRSFTLGAVMISMTKNDHGWVELLKNIIICSLINRAGFVLLYDHILK